MPPAQSTDPLPTPSPLKYAGFWVRSGALVIDGLLLVLVNVIVGFVVRNDMVMTVLNPLISWTYAVFMVTQYQATVGKMVVGLRVERTNGEKLTFGRAFLREIVGKIASALIVCVGYFMVAWTGKKQGLHDKIADSVVIEIDPTKSKTIWVVLGAVVPALVVLGALSAVALLSLNNAREKGTEAAVKAVLATALTEGEIYYAENGKSYAGYCEEPTTLQLLSSAAETSAGDPYLFACRGAADAWIAAVPMPNGGFGCVDSTGARVITSDLPSDDMVACGSGTYF